MDHTDFLNLCSFFKPLMDNLESQTYEVFEKDPIKYSQYQQVSIQHSWTSCLISTLESGYFVTNVVHSSTSSGGV